MSAWSWLQGRNRCCLRENDQVGLLRFHEFVDAFEHHVGFWIVNHEMGIGELQNFKFAVFIKFQLLGIYRQDKSQRHKCKE